MVLMANLNADFENTGFKLHIPVIDNVNDPLVKEITDYLDNEFGNIERTSVAGGTYRASIMGKNGNVYKVGHGSDWQAGDGITVYGKTSSRAELEKIANDIENKFGDRITAHRQLHNITLRDSDYNLTKNITTRFNAQNQMEIDVINGTKYTNIHFLAYDNIKNPSGAPTARTFRNSTGRIVSTSGCGVQSLSELDKKLLQGTSTLKTIDDFGEFFTGHIEDGKIPKHILDGLPKEFLDRNPNLLKELPLRIEKGTTQIAAHMLCAIAKEGINSPLMKSNEPWIINLEPRIIENAKTLLRKLEPETADKLEQILPQLEKIYPKLSIIRKPISQNNITSHTVVAKPSTIGTSESAIKKANINMDDVFSTFNRGQTVHKPALQISQTIPGITAPTEGVQMAKVNMDEVFSTFAKGTSQQKVIKPTTPVLADVIEGALQKVHKPTAQAIAKPNMMSNVELARIIKMAFSHLKI